MQAYYWFFLTGPDKVLLWPKESIEADVLPGSVFIAFVEAEQGYCQISSVAVRLLSVPSFFVGV